MGFDATLGFVINLGAPQSPVAYYQQVGRAGRGTDEATVVLLPARGPRHLGLLGLAGLPARGARPRDPRGAGRRPRPLSHRRAGDPRRPQPQPARVDAQGPRRRRRRPAACRAAGSRPASRGPTTPSATPASPRPASASSRRCSPTCATTECRMRYLREQLDDPEAEPTAAAATTAAGSPCRRRSPGGGRRGRRAASRPGVALEPRRMWPTALANLGLDLKGKIAGRRARPGPRPAHRPRPRPGAARAVPGGHPDGPVRPASPGRDDVMKDWSRSGPRARTRSSSSSPRPGPPWSATSPTGCPGSCRSR